MSRENIDALRVVYAEWGRGNWQTRFDVYDGEIGVGMVVRVPRSSWRVSRPRSTERAAARLAKPVGALGV